MRIRNETIKNNNRIIAISIALIAFFITHPVYAQLQHAETALKNYKMISFKRLFLLLQLSYFYA